MAIGQLGSLDYRMTFPQQQPTVGQPAYTGGGEGVGNTMPDSVNDPLAVREKLTSDYFNNYGLLQSFAQDMARKGINVFEPDYSQDGGGLAFQTMLKLKAGTEMASNALANELKAEQQMRPLEATGQTRFVGERTGMFASNPENYMPTAIDPLVVEANKALGDSRYTQSDSNRLNEAVRDPRIQYYQEQIAKDPQNAEYYQRQMKALLKNAPQVYAPAAFDRDGGSSKKPKYLALHKNITNHSRGAWAPGTYTTSVVRGKTYEANPELGGVRFGKGEIRDKTGRVIRTVDKVIKQSLKDENGNVYYQYEDPELPLELISNLPPNQLVARHIASDDAFGGSGAVAGYLNELDENGLIDPNTRSANPSVVFGEGAPELAKESKPKFTTDRELAHIKEQYNRLVNGEGDFNILTFTSPTGQKVKFKYDSNTDDSKDEGVYVENWQELGMNKDNRKKNLSLDDVLQLMDDYGFWQDIIEKKKQGGGATQSNKPDNLTARQQKAVVQFRIQMKRDPSESELAKLLEKYK